MSKRASVLGYVVLIVLMSAGAAQSLAGSNTVTTGDIVDGDVHNSDLGSDSVTAGKVKNGALAGADIKDDAITGADINEATLVLPTPIAYGFIGADGTIVDGSGVSDARWDADNKRYELTVTGEAYSYFQYATTITTICANKSVSVGSASGELLVYIGAGDQCGSHS